MKKDENLKINLGSGGRPLSDHLNVDINPYAKEIDLVCNLDVYPWPFMDEICDTVVMNHFLEHLVDHNRAMKEVHRILVRGGEAKIKVPHFTWQIAFQDPTHHHFFGYNTFSYYTHDHGYFDFKFSSCRVKLTFGKRLSLWNIILEPLFNAFPNAYEQSPLRIFPALTVDAVLTK